MSRNLILGLISTQLGLQIPFLECSEAAHGGAPGATHVTAETASSISTPPRTPSPLCIPSLSLAHRTGHETCWVKFYLEDRKSLCLNHSAWVKWLQLPPSSFTACFETPLRWKAYAPQINGVHLDTPEKPVFYVAHAQPSFHLAPAHLAQASSSWFSSPFSFWIQKLEKIREKTSTLLAPYDDFGILRSLLLNEKSSDSPTSMLRKLGFVHLASATGIHLYALAQSWDRILRSVFYAFPLPVRWGIWVSRTLSLGLCSCVWLLSGARLGMLRPGLVIALREISSLLGIRWRRASPLILALTLDFAVACVWAASGRATFQFSGRLVYALAVGGGLLWCRSFTSIHLGLAVGSWLLVALWEIWHSGTLALLTPLLSLISLPLTCLLVFPLMITCLLLGEWGLGSLTEWILIAVAQGFSKCLYFLARFAFLPGNLWVLTPTSLLIGFTLATGILLIQLSYFRRISFSFRSFLGIGVLLLGLRCLLMSFNGDLDFKSPPIILEQLDVGQGDSALIQDQRRSITHSKSPLVGLIDTGSHAALTDEAWLNLLAGRQITHLNWVALSHLDEDHSGGLQRLARLIEIDCVATPDPPKEDPKWDSHRRTLYQKALSHWNLRLEGWNSGCIPYPAWVPSYLPSSVPSRVPSRGPSSVSPFSSTPPPRTKKLSSRRKRPQHSGKRRPAARPNANMGSLWIPLENQGFYLNSGDAHREDELQIAQWLLQTQPQFFPQFFQRPTSISSLKNLKNSSAPRILKISHHGSKTSTSSEFLKIIQPNEVWISSGRGNRYRHPSIQTLERLKLFHVPIRRTDDLGRIRWEKGLEPGT